MLYGLSAQALMSRLCLELARNAPAYGLELVFIESPALGQYWSSPIIKDWEYYLESGNKRGQMFYKRAYILQTLGREDLWIISRGIEQGSLAEEKGTGDLLLAPFPFARKGAATKDRRLIYNLIPKIICQSENFAHSFMVYHEDGRLAAHRNSRFFMPLLYFLDPAALFGALKYPPKSNLAPKLVYPEIQPSFLVNGKFEPYSQPYKEDFAQFLSCIVEKILKGEHPCANIL